MVSRVTETEASVEASFYFNNIEVIYDVYLDVDGYKDNGNVLLDFDTISFDISLRYIFATERFVPVVSTPSVPVTYLKVSSHPNNGYFQLVAK